MFNCQTCYCYEDPSLNSMMSYVGYEIIFSRLYLPYT